MVLRLSVVDRLRCTAGILAITGLSSPPPAMGQRAGLTIERITASPSLIGTAPSRPTWSPDSRRLAFLWNDQGQSVRDLWLVRKSGTKPKRITGLDGSGPGSGGVSEFVWTPDSRSLLYLQGGDVWRILAEGGTAERLTNNGGSKSDVGISPDGSQVSFLQN